ncbi:2-C-methyl-D-erythritol 2,4-cyclodiphosphate synthase [Paraglaciecola psychrophila]|jgi:2-C-methyl-D-erythritol 2,4-cyclodiphosphate synthase|uniref:2-C-methyl-D-erythritol 2,4-cyclodiphosphate synthase n=1 Tax=Paraglaciecola psychrophila 170 TaxID=1129794 RepID=K6ZWC8_9ALTE|nr:2-C-methyl-D-erythritol 2,4-cyclodiphosphate synthase [Paraglaciecola psychrophila]AGH47052.1 2-C-methyl-D-erythritol 2,4-cyclodiphosphate synthase [Paraglaciecola psychrophila 170]GAC40196.1 2-C-methyl-D-erythritol 2,4-cyclodiphosphate synthase [Paraglaciecola psychrophila 170]
MSIRIGHGYDVHKFGGSGPIVIAGVKIEHDMGLIAHSDGDVVLHALCDALLGALALGDIGKHFPDTDPTLAGVDSRELLRHVYKLITDQQYQLGNLDLTIVAQAPKMAPHIELMRKNIAEDLSADIAQVNVKATTTEKLGFAGRKEGMAAYAVVLLTQQLDTAQ